MVGNNERLLLHNVSPEIMLGSICKGASCEVPVPPVIITFLVPLLPPEALITS